jgi:glycosyltransferase involved in cell wall biosynthesis
MRIALFIDESANREIGGGYSYLSKLVQSIDKYDFKQDLEFFFITKYANSKYEYNKKVIYYGDLIPKPSFLSKIRIKKINFEIEFNKALVSRLLENKIDLLYYPQAETFVVNYPYVMTSWDLGHRSTYVFPEMTMNNVFELRNEHRLNALHKATAVIVESEESKKELIKYAQIFDKKIFILPLPPGNVVELNPTLQEEQMFLEKFKLIRNNFFLYPAQFWSHKNHYNLILAFKKYLNIHPNTHLVFTGSDKGNLEYIKEICYQLNLNSDIKFLGFVSDMELNILYKNAISLVFPSLLGPTNMPIIEALQLNCKVICSDFEGHRSLANENALYFNPLNPDDIFFKMMEIKCIEKSDCQNSKNEYIGECLEQIFLQIMPYRKTFGLNFNQF